MCGLCLCLTPIVSQEFSPHPGGETEALRRLDDSLADQVTLTITLGTMSHIGVFGLVIMVSYVPIRFLFGATLRRFGE
jgi:hypothetical protein